MLMHSCWGTSMVITRRSTFRTVSMKGMIKTNPGPLSPTNLPSRKTPTLSYSRTTLIAALRIEGCSRHGFFSYHFLDASRKLSPLIISAGVDNKNNECDREYYGYDNWPSHFHIT